MYLRVHLLDKPIVFAGGEHRGSPKSYQMALTLPFNSRKSFSLHECIDVFSLWWRNWRHSRLSASPSVTSSRPDWQGANHSHSLHNSKSLTSFTCLFKISIFLFTSNCSNSKFQIPIHSCIRTSNTLTRVTTQTRQLDKKLMTIDQFRISDFLIQSCHQTPDHQTRILQSESVPVVFTPKRLGHLRQYLCLTVKGISMAQDARGVKLGFWGSEISDSENTPFYSVPMRQFASGGLVTRRRFSLSQARCRRKASEFWTDLMAE